MNFVITPIKTEQDAVLFKQQLLAKLSEIENNWRSENETRSKTFPLARRYYRLFSEIIDPILEHVNAKEFPYSTLSFVFKNILECTIRSKPTYSDIYVIKSRIDFELGVDSDELSAFKSYIRSNKKIPATHITNKSRAWSLFNCFKLRNYSLKKETGLTPIIASKLNNRLNPDIEKIMFNIEPPPALVSGLDELYFRQAVGDAEYLNYIFDTVRYSNIEAERTLLRMPSSQSLVLFKEWLSQTAVSDEDKLNTYLTASSADNLMGMLVNLPSGASVLENVLLPHIKDKSTINLINAVLLLKIDKSEDIKEYIQYSKTNIENQLLPSLAVSI